MGRIIPNFASMVYCGLKIPLLLTLILFAVGCSKSAKAPEKPQTPAVKAEKSAARENFSATLFYLSKTRSTFKPTVVSIPPAVTREGKILNLLAAFATQPPPEKAISPLPEGMKPRAVYFPETIICVVDLSYPAPPPLQVGSRQETLFVYSIVNSILLNFADIKSVKILINGKEPLDYFSHLDATIYYKANLHP